MDVISLLPLEILYLYFGTSAVVLRLPRMCKAQTFSQFYNSLDKMLSSPLIVSIFSSSFLYMYIYLWSWQIIAWQRQNWFLFFQHNKIFQNKVTNYVCSNHQIFLTKIGIQISKISLFVLLPRLY